MPERISRLKAKLLGRLSPKADADPSAHFNQKTPSRPLDSNRSDSIASSNLDIGSSRDRQVKEPLSGTNQELNSSVSTPSEQPHHTGTRNCTPSTEPYNSSLPTPISADPPSPLETPPLSTPPHSDTTSFQSTHLKAQTPILPETPLTPALDTVVEWPTNDRRPSTSYFPPSSKRPSLAIRRQSLLPATQQHLISGLLDASLFSSGDQGSGFTPLVPHEMVTRRVWVKRPGGSATLVPCRDDAVVDELRDQVIMKYGNSLGRSFDSPDIAIRVSPREGTNRPGHTERLLSPEEALSSILDAYYPGGQKIEEALVIDAPSRRTPKPSPRHSIYQHHSEPGEHGDYFPLMPPVNANAGTPSAHSGSASAAATAPSISILNTGVAPPLLPSPGSRRARHQQRPPLTRHKTNSPTILHNQNTQTPGITETGATPHSQPIPPPSAPAVPTPPPSAPPAESPQVKSHTPPATASPRVVRKSKAATSPGAMFGGLIDGTVPPINVLIVEDNIINQKLLEAFMKRLKVRWKCAMNGEEAVRKWRQGGFHLVLMDIQLPVMNGLEATKEIRRLERLNGIGVFPKTASGRFSASSTSPADRRPGLHRTVSEEDTLSDLSLFRSPVIIVALTASSLQSDRHEALAAGCNDFLTKPVGFPWLEQKVTEWGCMQALIDFEGWRKWRGFLDSPRPASPVDTSASPMQGGYRKEPPQVDPPSPSTSRPANKSDHHEAKPHLPDVAQIMREDSWGSGSPDSLDSLSSPQLPTPGDTVPSSSATAAPPGGK
ncbi:hypothetical protein N7489_010489 [Penicillium chrysogenum]|uniref:Response regulatory domain-containing protein n=1 Tax=Penicillium chrysogenum TaxID=5076 RepID=A0ABQ8WU70_PENCH|nr:uncharacterized protein N7489_010489 [Penicillium chrysogenum]KAJ5229781.1 hypothetical protein N7489_010489 [Penicillium chrysogenum]KAJ5259186.1 hypothetical protein N7524_010742 [Penicillium chrysogenum]KAJ5282332.1 hypothetical protein N7505_000312 [Penicillium chrysogenum]